MDALATAIDHWEKLTGRTFCQLVTLSNFREDATATEARLLGRIEGVLDARRVARATGVVTMKELRDQLGDTHNETEPRPRTATMQPTTSNQTEENLCQLDNASTSSHF
jgi:hypothetical protein